MYSYQQYEESSNVHYGSIMYWASKDNVGDNRCTIHSSYMTPIVFAEHKEKLRHLRELIGIVLVMFSSILTHRQWWHQNCITTFLLFLLNMKRSLCNFGSLSALSFCCFHPFRLIISNDIKTVLPLWCQLYYHFDVNCLVVILRIDFKFLLVNFSVII